MYNLYNEILKNTFERTAVEMQSQINKESIKISEQTRSMREIIHETLREGILTGQYESGFHLRERELATRFGVSTTPIKEALRSLEQEGLVYTLPRKGTYVSNSIMKSIEEITWARSSLEGVAARLAALKITKDELDQLEAIIDKMKIYTQKKDGQIISQTNDYFHELIRKAAKNNFIFNQIEAVRTHYRFLSNKALAHTDELDRAYKEHYQIFEYIQSGDLDGAEETMRNHIRRTTTFVKKRNEE